MVKLILGFISSLIVLLARAIPAAASTDPGSKRGLVYIPSSIHPEDDSIWPQSTTLTWYYGYTPNPATSLPNQKIGSNVGFQFVPMLWGDYDNTFVEDVRKLRRDGYNIKHVLGFNEPDMRSDWGGSNITPSKAAERWKKDIQPLKADGLLLGAPSPAGTEDGKKWLSEFFTACTGCTIDFIPLHWYGDFQGLASHLGHYSAMYPGMKFWLTELAFAHQDLLPTQQMFNQTVAYLDTLENVERYSWFGSFRSDVSNVGPNSAMLTPSGTLTALGNWYLYH